MAGTESKRLLVVIEELARLEGLEVWTAGPIIKTALSVVRAAAGAGQPATLGKLIRVEPRPAKPDRGRIALLAIPARALVDVVTGTRVEPIGGAWHPDEPVSAAELVRVVGKHTGETQGVVRKALHGLEAVVSDTLVSGVPVILTDFVSFHLNATYPNRVQTAALVSVVLGPKLSTLAKTFEAGR